MHVCVERKEAGMAHMNCLIQVQISVGMLECKCQCTEGRMEGGSPDFCGYVSTDMLFHVFPPPFCSCLCLNVKVSFSVVNDSYLSLMLT